MSNDKLCKLIFEDFKIMYPYYVSDVVNYYWFDNMELMIELNDDTKFLYDYMDKSIIFINRPEQGQKIERDETQWRMEFARRLRKKMRHRCMNQTMLSEATDLSISSISKYINGQSLPSIHATQKLAKALGCSVLDLLHFPE